MPTPFLFHDLFATRTGLSAEPMKIPGLGDIAIIDGFYEHPDAITDLLAVSAASPWKIGPGSRNYQDYFDCWTTLPAHPTYQDARDNQSQAQLWRIIKDSFGLSIKQRRYPFDFNMFQWIRPPAPNVQFYPHVDGSGVVAAIIYLNRDADTNGGTAFYRDNPLGVTAAIGYHEQDNLQVDISAHCNLATVVPARFNRCILFPGWFTHGAYIEQHDFFTGDRWRLTQPYFFAVDK
jgi:hypothetical protein